MSTQKKEPFTKHASDQGVLSTRKQAQVDELLVQMRATTNPDELVALAERLKLLAQQPADELHTFDESELPEWSIHEEDQENLNAFFNEPADRGNAESAFTIPRGASDPKEFVSGAANKEYTFAHEGEAEPEGKLTEPKQDLAEPETKQEAEELELEAKSRQETGLSPEPVVAVSEAMPELELTPQPEPTPEPEPMPESVASESKPATEHTPVPRREDFARFRCIYESKDGKLALYEDAEGHLTAVNTNRFI